MKREIAAYLAHALIAGAQNQARHATIFAAYDDLISMLRREFSQDAHMLQLLATLDDTTQADLEAALAASALVPGTRLLNIAEAIHTAVQTGIPRPEEAIQRSSKSSQSMWERFTQIFGGSQPPKPTPRKPEPSQEHKPEPPPAPAPPQERKPTEKSQDDPYETVEIPALHEGHEYAEPDGVPLSSEIERMTQDEMSDWLEQLAAEDDETGEMRGGAAPETPKTITKGGDGDDVRFRLYAPRESGVGVRAALLVYAFVGEALASVEADVTKFTADLGGAVPRPKEAKQTANLERGTPITVVPESDELTFEPAQLTKTWHGDLTRYPFEFRPAAAQVDETAVVRVSVQIQGIEIASVRCAVDIISETTAVEPLAISANPLAVEKFTSQTTTPYQRIFISYSRRDSRVARAYKFAQTALGNEAFLDVDDLRTGENWQAALAKAIDEADVFQLFWSEHSAGSKYCRYEWEYALSHRCPDQQCVTFIRPVYWDRPMPHAPDELRHLNFKYLPMDETDSFTGQD